MGKSGNHSHTTGDIIENMNEQLRTAIAERVSLGYSKDQIINELVGAGYDAHEAGQLYDMVVSQDASAPTTPENQPRWPSQGNSESLDQKENSTEQTTSPQVQQTNVNAGAVQTGQVMTSGERADVGPAETPSPNPTEKSHTGLIVSVVAVLLIAGVFIAAILLGWHRPLLSIVGVDTVSYDKHQDDSVTEDSVADEPVSTPQNDEYQGDSVTEDDVAMISCGTITTDSRLLSSRDFSDQDYEIFSCFIDAFAECEPKLIKVEWLEHDFYEYHIIEGASEEGCVGRIYEVHHSDEEKNYASVCMYSQEDLRYTVNLTRGNDREHFITHYLRQDHDAGWYYNQSIEEEVDLKCDDTQDYSVPAYEFILGSASSITLLEPGDAAIPSCGTFSPSDDMLGSEEDFTKGGQAEFLCLFEAMALCEPSSMRVVDDHESVYFLSGGPDSNGCTIGVSEGDSSKTCLLPQDLLAMLGESFGSTWREGSMEGLEIFFELFDDEFYVDDAGSEIPLTCVAEGDRFIW